MGRRLPFFPTCGSPTKTLSFRATTISGDLQDMVVTGDIESPVESVIRGLSSDRFFFKPGKTSSILEEAKPKQKQKHKEQEQEQESVSPLKENVSMMEMESTHPFVDFKKSMQEMVEADEGLREWENLQQLLSLYLAVNDKINHGYIISAFVDFLLVNLGSSSSSSPSSINGQESIESTSNNKKMIMISSSSNSESPESSLSFTSSSCASSSGSASISHCLSSISSLEEEEEDDDDEDHNSPQKVAVSSSDYASSSL